MTQVPGNQIKKIFDEEADPGKVPAHFAVLLWQFRLVDIDFTSYVCTRNMPPLGPWFLVRAKPRK